ncbi:MAG: peptidylprolyl isomerase [Thermoanaerobaculales bacterium]|nr:peptidylprolyl isomerase [Thermoanaerobaculales bacterium]
MRKALLWAVLLAVSIAMPLAAQVKESVVVVTVNDQPIYSWEVGLMIPQVQRELASRGAPPKQEDVINMAMRRIIDSRLLGQEALRRKLKSDDARVATALEQIEAQAGGREGLNAALSRLGATYEQLRASVSETDLVRVFVTTQIEAQITVTMGDVAVFYDENPQMFERPDMVRARHILIRLQPTSTTADKKEARTRATSAHQRVVAGEDFATVAREVSEGNEASNGGDMGFFAQDSMMPALTNVAFALEIGEISDIIETQFGFHILKLEEKRAASKMLYEEAKIPVRQLLIEERTGEKLAELLEQLNKAATIVQVVQSADAPAS